jgi:TRAP-type uncharacterized transport system substrate-binding protein
MKTIRPLAWAAALALGLAGQATAEVKLTGETSGKGSVPHYVLTHLGEAASAAGVASLQIAEGQTLTNSVRNVAEGKSDVVGCPLVLPFLLSKGLGPYSALDKAKAAELAGNLRALYPYNVGLYTMMAFEAKGYSGWADLKGKTVYNGPPRGAALTNARQAIQMNAGLADGKDYKGLQANWDALSAMLVDGSADAYVIPVALPHARVSVMSSAGKVAIYSTPKSVMDSELGKKLTNFPGNIPYEAPIDGLGYVNDPNVRIVSEDNMFRGLGSAFTDVVNKDMPFELAKALTKVHIDTLKDLKAKAPSLANVGLAEMDPAKSAFCGANPLKYHPGAVAAWTEAGYTIPACAQAN